MNRITQTGPSERITPRETIAKCMRMGLTRAAAKREYERIKLLEWWGNNIYSVSVQRDSELHQLGASVRVVHISVHRRDRAPVTDWRDMQQIKNAVVGPEAEALSIHPAELRVVDTANEFHLWAAFDRATGNPLAVPMGFPTGMRLSKATEGAVQRPINREGDTAP